MTKNNLTKEEMLVLPIGIYNHAILLTRVKDPRTNDVILSMCGDCGRYYTICCICDVAEKKWDKMLAEVKEVSITKRISEKQAKPITITKEDAVFLWQLLPIWIKEFPVGLAPMFYGTLDRNGDIKIANRVKKILFGG